MSLALHPMANDAAKVAFTLVRFTQYARSFHFMLNIFLN